MKSASPRGPRVQSYNGGNQESPFEDDRQWGKDSMNSYKKIRLMLVGTGGYAQFYLETLSRPELLRKAEFVCAVDPFMSAETKSALEEKGVRTFADMQKAYDEMGPVDLTFCVTPLPYHLENIRTAVRNGSHVLCEKPAAPVLEQLEPMIALEKTSGRGIAIGFQWSFAPAMLACKRDILNGKFGKPLYARALVLWPRPESYFRRGTGWGGRRYGRDGMIINDSVASNATAHYLHNLYFMLGDAMNTSAMPAELEASIGRANNIENYDTVSIRAKLENGAEILYLASHAVEHTQNPMVEFHFEKAVVSYDCDTNCLTARCADGSVVEYGQVDSSVDNKVNTVVDTVREGDWSRVPCLPSTTRPHVYTVDALFHHAEIVSFPQEMIGVYEPDDPEKRGIFVRGLEEELHKAYEANQPVDFLETTTKRSLKKVLS